MIRIQNRKKFDYLKSLILNFLPTISHLNKIIKNEDINIVHSNDLFDVYGPIAAFVNRTPSIQHIRWILNSNTIIKYLISIYIALVNTKIIAVSNGVVNRMLLVPKFLKSKVTVCYDWVDFKLTGIMHIDNNLRNIFKISKDSVIICTIGRLDPWKGQDIFIKAASLISIEFKNVYFLVVGGSVQGKGRENYTEELIQLAIKENISDRIYFAGERNDINNILESIDIFIHSSVLHDPFPGVVLEAMSASKPIIASNCGGVPEQIENFKSGLLFEPGNANDLYNKIKLLLKNRDFASKLGYNAKSRYNTYFDKSALCKRIENLYLSLFNNKFYS